jgi:tRNA uridine 5-carbamoylmethylation protein Kti12
MKLIGISGQKQSGKDTFAKHLAPYLGGNCRILHFADELKREVSCACDVSVEELEQNKEVYRTILQWWGTEFRRKYKGDDNYWVDKVADDVNVLSGFLVDLAIIVADVRFMNEVDYIKNNGGYLIRIVRPSQMSNDTHSSETSLSPFTGWDEIVVNDGMLSDLQIKALQVSKRILNKNGVTIYG